MTPMSGREGEGFGDARRSRPSAMRVVGGIEDYRRRAADEFQPARKVHLGESLADHVRVQRLQSEERLRRGERLRGIRSLMCPVERQKDLVDRTIRAGEPEDLPGHRELAVDDAEVDALPLRQGADLGASGKQDLRSFDALPSKDGVRARLDDAGLLSGDLGDRTAQQVGVIKIDRGDHSDTGIGHVGGIPGTAQADLDDRDIHRCIGERGIRHRGDDLEEGHLDAVDLALINECDVRLDLTPQLVEALVGDRLAVNGDPLRHAHHVRAGESAGAQTIGPQQRFDHRSGAALAVGPGQVDDGIRPAGGRPGVRSAP